MFKYSSSRAGILLLLVSFLNSTCQAFVSPAAATRSAFAIGGTFPASSLSTLPLHLLQGGLDMSSLMLADSDGAVVDAAADAAVFTDSIDIFGGPIKIMVGLFGVVVIALVALKALADRMDTAINKVLFDFEATLRRFHPQRWQEMETELEGLEGDTRDVKLLTMMEGLQDTDPVFMNKVEEQMKSSA